MIIDFTKIIYGFKDIPKRKLYLIKRLKEIYPEASEETIRKVLRQIRIRFREQDQRGCSNHEIKTIYVPLKDVKKKNLKNRRDAIEYFEDPKSVIVHETMHIFQNLAGAFPNIKYLDEVNGKIKIDYDKYINDPGEKQARLEQVLELLDWGFTRAEIINWLYNRQHNDKDLWNRLITDAKELRRKST